MIFSLKELFHQEVNENMKIVKENIIKTYRYGDNNLDFDILIETMKQYYYESKEEKEKHKAEMESKGFEDSGRVRENIGTIESPNHTWFGSYSKFDVVRSDFPSDMKVVDFALLATGGYFIKYNNGLTSTLCKAQVIDKLNRSR